MTTQELITSISGCFWNTTHLGLERVRALLSAMGEPQRELKFVHVAGTNGKGSACAMLSSILKEAGYKTGMYTSPHLSRLNERFVIDGEEISDEALRDLAERSGALIDDLPEKPTEFEVLSAMAMLYFREMRCDIVVLEVGLGGRLDATNAIDSPEAAVIMNIGLEHTEYLGDTLEKVAGEKAGIIKPGCKVVAYRGAPEVEAVFSRVCREKGAHLTLADFDGIEVLCEGPEGSRFCWHGMENIDLPLIGGHQIKNAVVVLETVESLRSKGWGIDESAVRRGISGARWPARLELLCREPLVILDGAHNPQCAETMAKALPMLLGGKRAVFLTGVLADKDYAAIMSGVLPFAQSFVTVTPDSPRALPASELAEHLRGRGAEALACDSVGQGVKAALHSARGAPVVIFGSLYMAGAVRDCFFSAFRDHQRKCGIEARESLTAERREEYSRRICASLLESPEFIAAGTIMSYRAVRAEVSLRSLDTAARAMGKRVVYPRCVGKTELAALLPESEEAFTAGSYGIPEPTEAASLEVAPEDIDLVLCPCAAFDDSRSRLGMGAGYYDRFLPGCKNARVAAVAFEAQRLPEIMTAPWDKTMDAVFTENARY